DPGVLLQRGGGEEELAEPGADLGDQQLSEGASLGALTGLEALLQPLADHLQRTLGRGVVATALLEELLPRLGEEQPAAEGIPLQRGAGDGLARAPPW